MDPVELLIPPITDSLKIQGIIKQKPEDFIVGEIIENNQILDPRKKDFILPGKNGLFVHFVLIKKDIDSATALDWIARLWKIPRNNISIAGMKDKRAFTAQRVSVWGVKNRLDSKKLEEISLPKIKTKSLCSRINEIRLGNLLGNNFEITIRGIPNSEEETNRIVEESLNEIRNLKYLPNGYGIQRFGDKRPITHLVGKRLLLGDARGALRYYIGKVFKTEDESSKKARNHYWESEDIQGTIGLLPSQLNIERKMLLELQKTKNYEQVFFSLSIQFQKIFVHALQSYLFNKYLGIRLEEYSRDLKKPIEGEKILNNQIHAPLIGSKSELEGNVKEIYQRIMKDEGLLLKDFQSSLAKKLGSKGAFRVISMKPKGLELHNVSKDNLNKGKTKVIISFQLQRGSYATEVLKQIIK